jgi:hypothetical protein
MMARTGKPTCSRTGEIVTLRTDNSESDVILVDGVGSGHRATDVLTGPAAGIV